MTCIYFKSFHEVYNLSLYYQGGLVQCVLLLSRYSIFFSLFSIIPEEFYVVEDYIDSTLRCRLFEYYIVFIYIIFTC